MALTEQNLFDEVRLFAQNCAVCYGSAKGAASSSPIAKGLYQKPPQQARKVLDQNMSVSTALPCRISIYAEGGKTILAALKPTVLLAMFNALQLEGVAQEVEATIVKIMKEAAS